jgi:hypothetical protein
MSREPLALPMLWRMDDQFACATFATLIPVLLIAGHFSLATLAVADQLSRFRRQLALNIAALLVVEVAEIYGVAYPAHWLVIAGIFGATGATVGMFVPALMRDLSGPEGEAGQVSEGDHGGKN